MRTESEIDAAYRTAIRAVSEEAEPIDRLKYAYCAVALGWVLGITPPDIWADLENEGNGT